MTDVCQNWPGIEVNKRNRAEIPRNNNPQSHYNRRGPGRSVILIPLTTTICAVYCLQTSTYSVTLFVATRSILLKWHLYFSGLTIKLCFVGLTFVTGTKDFMITTQSTNNDHITTFICSPKSAHYPFIEAMLKNFPLNHIKSQNGTFWTTDRNRQFYSGSLALWKRRTHHLNASIRNINLTVTLKHTTQLS